MERFYGWVGILGVAGLCGCSTPSPSVSGDTDDLRRQLSELQKIVSNHTAQIDRLTDLLQKKDSQNAPLPPLESVTPSTPPAVIEQSPVEEARAVPTTQPVPSEKALESPVRGEPMALPNSKEKSPMDSWDDETLFNTAYSLRITNPREATVMFGRLVQKYPESPLADNALYWLGTIQYDMGAVHQAVIFWDKILRDFPDSNKVPDALLAMATGYEKLNQKEKAQIALSRLKQDHPTSKAALRAGQ